MLSVTLRCLVLWHVSSNMVTYIHQCPQCEFCQRTFNSRPGKITTKFSIIHYHIAPYSQCRHVRLVVSPHSINALGTNPRGLFCLCLQRKRGSRIGDSDLMWPDCERLVTPSCLLAAGIGNWWSGAYSKPSAITVTKPFRNWKLRTNWRLLIYTILGHITPLTKTHAIIIEYASISIIHTFIKHTKLILEKKEWRRL